MSAPAPAPTPSMAVPSTAPAAPPSAAPQTNESSSRPEPLRRRRSGLPIQRSITPPRRPDALGRVAGGPQDPAQARTAPRSASRARRREARQRHPPDDIGARADTTAE